MTESLYLLGAPGVGKSTVMERYIAARGWKVLPETLPLYGLLKGQAVYSPDTGRVTAYYLGKMRERFPGTDALSMGVAPDARAWAQSLSPDTRPFTTPEWVLGEGARLGNVGFLRELASSTSLTLVLLTADEETLALRRAARGSNQSPSWMRGAATGALNAFTAASPYASRALALDARQPVDDLVSALRVL